MTLTRRNFLTGALGATALAGMGLRPARAAAATPIVARVGTAMLAPPGYPQTPIWGYDGTVPGQQLRVAQGARLRVDFRNELIQPTTVHWHGLRLDNAMDGVPDLTQAAVQPGESFLYDFVAPDAGTYWYHPHNRTSEQMARGLYGGLVVTEALPPEVDRDEVLLIDDWRLTAEASIDESFGNMMDRAHGGRLGNWLTVNGKSGYRLAAPQHQRLRLRLVNTANARVFTLFLAGLEGWIVALDGQPLVTPAPAGQIILGPAQRADLIVDVTAEADGPAHIGVLNGEESFRLVRFDVADRMRTDRLPRPDSLTPNLVAPIGPLASARRVDLAMAGGAMGSMRGAMMSGRRMDMRELVSAGMAWSFNGQAAMPDEPLLTASAGETVRIAMINDTPWAHAMHLHGHHFRRIGADDRLGPLRDTLMVAPDETAEIALTADNPGDWLLHCHMLEHAESGMMTWLRVNS